MAEEKVSGVNPWLVRLLAIVLAACQAYVTRYQMNPDGISYLDLSDGVLHHDWGRLVNAYWSPLYPLLLGVVRACLPKATAWEFPAVHVANLVAFVLLWLSFERFVQFLTEVRLESPPPPARRWRPETLLVGAFLTWCGLTQVDLGMVTPDLLLMAVAVAATTYALDFLRRREPRSFYWLCLFLGLGYLTKAVFLVPSIVAMAMAGGAVLRRRVSIRVFAIGVAIFLTIAGPWVVLLSRAKGRLTTGDVSRLAYSWYVNGVDFVNWQGREPKLGTPVHPTQRFFKDPPAYSFEGIFEATYPPWFDPSYWNEGLRPRLKLRQWALASFSQIGSLFIILFLAGPGYVVLVLCTALAFRASVFPGGTLRTWALPLTLGAPPSAALAALCLVHVEPRLVAPFLLSFFVSTYVACWSGRRTIAGSEAGSGPAALAAIAAGLLILSVAPGIAARTYGAATGRGMPTVLQQVAAAERAGIRAGSKVAVIGYPFDHYWARLSRARIVAHVDGSVRDLSVMEKHKREALMMSIRELGCVAIVGTKAGPDDAGRPPWIVESGLAILPIGPAGVARASGGAS